MTARSWSVVARDPPEHRLPGDLAARDPFGGRDAGWVGAMRPLVRAFSPPGGRVLDPFCGFGTTLLAAALEGRSALGHEIDPARAALARERLGRHGLTPPAVRVADGSAADLPPDARFDLVLTSVPYFGGGWRGDAIPGQLYHADDVAAWRRGLRGVFHALRRHVVEGGYVIATVEDVRVGGRVVAQAAELVGVLGSLFRAEDARVLCYPRRDGDGPADAGDTPAGDAGAEAGRTDRTHEQVLVYRHVREAIDLAATAALLDAMRADGFDVVVHGSWAAWSRDPANARPPGDLDLVVPRDEDALRRLVAWLLARGFDGTFWGEPLAAPPDLATLARHHYLRAERRARDGGLIRVDLSLAPS